MIFKSYQDENPINYGIFDVFFQGAMISSIFGSAMGCFQGDV